MDTSKDYYAILGVLPSMDQVALGAVYRALVKKYHPDVFGGNKEEADRITKGLNEAYSILGDVAQRAHYDRLRGIRRENSRHREYQSDTAKGTEQGPVAKTNRNMTAAVVLAFVFAAIIYFTGNGSRPNGPITQPESVPPQAAQDQSAGNAAAQNQPSQSAAGLPDQAAQPLVGADTEQSVGSTPNSVAAPPAGTRDDNQSVAQTTRPKLSGLRPEELPAASISNGDIGSSTAPLGQWLATEIGRAQAGNAESAYNVASMYEHGVGVGPNKDAAIAWYRRSEAQGFAAAGAAIERLGGIARRPTSPFNSSAPFGRSISTEIARAEAGDAEAAYNVGSMYENGIGTTQDANIAKQWYQRSAGGGFGAARTALARLR